LRILLDIPETNAPYQQLSLPLADRHRITLCTYFRASSKVPSELKLLDGDGTLRGFVRVLREALRSGPYDVIHVHTPHVAVVLLAITWWNLSLMRSTVFTVHNCYENTKTRNKLLLLPVFAFFRRVVCCGRTTFESFPAVFRWLAGRRLRFVVNGVNTERIDGVRQVVASDTGSSLFHVASVSRLVPIKNLALTLDAFERVAKQDQRDVCLTFVGEGPLLDALAEQSSDLGVNEFVHFTGLLKRDDVYRYLLQSDLYVSASRGEGLPVGVLEAMACCCPVVLSDIAPHREIADGVDFIPLLDPNDVDGFAREIRRFREMTPADCREIGSKCSRLARERFSLKAMHDGYESIFDEVKEPSVR
jgi:glycosyltransferase involved in cell wall biosynthesis